MGYAKHDQLRYFRRAKDHPAYAISLNDLRTIEELSQLFPEISR